MLILLWVCFTPQGQRVAVKVITQAIVDGMFMGTDPLNEVSGSVQAMYCWLSRGDARGHNTRLR
jgi:hypothetical protein